jgi:hypothetical protein
MLVCGAMAGFAMGIKYTSFVLPIAILIYIAWQTCRDGRRLVSMATRFVFMAILTGCIWYIRNWIWTGNPIYPFVFGGPYWDTARAAWYSGAGSGIGWSLSAFVSLPFVTMLGYRDQTYSDGRFGPLYLILFPLVLAVIWQAWKNRDKNLHTIFLLMLFGSLFSSFWVLGVINTEHLRQARLLWSGLIPFVPLMAAGILRLDQFDTSRFRPSFVFSALAGVMVFSFLLDFGLFVIVRNPLGAALGMEPRSSYIARMQPGYAQAISLAEETPVTAHIYLLNEPRMYGIDRFAQSDPFNDNLPHDFYIYPTNEGMIEAWRGLGYTHVLAQKSVFAATNPPELVAANYSQRVALLMSVLIKVDETTDYVLFEIPPK